jgi:hypothetical protein
MSHLSRQGPFGVVTVLGADDRMQRNARPVSACADGSSHPQCHSHGSASIVVSEGFDTYELDPLCSCRSLSTR